MQSKNIKDLIKSKADIIEVCGGYRDLKVALSLFDKENEYEIVCTSNSCRYILRRKTK